MNRARSRVEARMDRAALRAFLRGSAAVALFANGAAHAAQFAINGPAGSGRFGTSVTALPNGNIVVTDPSFDASGQVVDVGAVYLFRPDGTLISTLVGSTANDQIGSAGITVLETGNFLVHSPAWDNGATPDAGALSFGYGNTGIDGEVSSENSLVGGSTGDAVGNGVVSHLGNGNFVVAHVGWDNGAARNAGAVTFGLGDRGVTGLVSPTNSLVGNFDGDLIGSGGVTPLSNGNYVVGSPYCSVAAISGGAVTHGSAISGVSGPISIANSLVGDKDFDLVGSGGVLALTNGNYVVVSPGWSNGTALFAGAATFASGTTGITGTVSPQNSLVGSSRDDRVGASGITQLRNGNYVVVSSGWDSSTARDVGAVTLGSASTGISGVVSPSNSLVGSSHQDNVGSDGVTALTNGNYVVSSRLWDNGTVIDAGAVTFGRGDTGITGTVSASNSLVGGRQSDEVGSDGVFALSSGNYVVASRSWDNGTLTNAGAATFGSGEDGIAGLVSSSNSLVGGNVSDFVGSSGVTVLSNGNYVVQSPFVRNGDVANAGAATFGSGTSGVVGIASRANSLVGSSMGDDVGRQVVAIPQNGNYVVLSPNWNNGAATDAGGVTFGPGSTGISGEVSPENSLVGSRPDDRVGHVGAVALSTGDFAVASPYWDHGAMPDAGAVTFGSGSTGIIGEISATNSLVGESVGDQVGWRAVEAMSNGNYVVHTPGWRNGAIVGAGAVTLGLLDASVVGFITNTHSVLGDVSFSGASQVSSYDAARNQLVVGQPAANRVILHRTGIETAIALTGDDPDPSSCGESVTFTATLVSSPSTPTDGKVTFTADTGESCFDTTPTSVSSTTVEYSCSMVFSQGGVSSVIAEFTGSLVHAYSGSLPQIHTTLESLFVDGFEEP